jgi:hypothetical protein
MMNRNGIWIDRQICPSQQENQSYVLRTNNWSEDSLYAEYLKHLSKVFSFILNKNKLELTLIKDMGNLVFNDGGSIYDIGLTWGAGLGSLKARKREHAPERRP